MLIKVDVVLSKYCMRCSDWLYMLQRLDVERETIELVHTNPTETRELPYRIPTDSPRYHFFVFKHSHQDQLQEALGNPECVCVCVCVCACVCCVCVCVCAFVHACA